ncbi:hypothetical protein O6H91_18G032500 [Diphasiastrum complanatum]|uniref:Uncharacterized protein n=2 Tax=Diphasiastrum complanatum TaxID=34168 RepID=A0ACC2AZK9_DIPCM|nr:hypothetical protein O6H91_18G032500 [Diphasiastrum complanatum]
MKIEASSADHLVVRPVSCSDPATFQDLEEAMVAGNSHKRQIYSVFETSEDTGDDDAADDYSHNVGKKRRLTADQVKALEKNFELENKLEPERKLHLARELGLQPRQVAVWFQNRRARWKTKQLEKDYDILKADYDTLTRDYDMAVQEKEKLQAQILCLNEKLKNTDSENPPPISYALELRREISKESSAQLPKQVSNETAQPDLISLSPLILRVAKEGSSNSDSDDSEVLDVESPLPKDNPICSNLPNLACVVPPSLINIGKGDHEKVLPHHTPQRSIVKLEDESYPEEKSNYIFTLEDQVTGFSWWDWS